MLCDGYWYPVGYRRAPSHNHKGKKIQIQVDKKYKKKYIQELPNGVYRCLS